MIFEFERDRARRTCPVQLGVVTRARAPVQNRVRQLSEAYPRLVTKVGKKKRGDVIGQVKKSAHKISTSTSVIRKHHHTFQHITIIDKSDLLLAVASRPHRSSRLTRASESAYFSYFGSTKLRCRHCQREAGMSGWSSTSHSFERILKTDKSISRFVLLIML